MEQTIETLCSLRQVGLSGTMEEALAKGGGILTVEDGKAGSLAGLLSGVREGLGVELATGKGSRSKRVVLSGNPMLGVQGSGYEIKLKEKQRTEGSHTWP